MTSQRISLHDANPPRPTPTASAPEHWHSRGYLPHFESSARLQMITYRLADSLPAAVAEKLFRKLSQTGSSAAYRKAVESYIDSGYGSCLLGNPNAASIVRQVWFNRNEVDYRMHAWVIMPNHVHILVDVFPHSTLSLIVKTWKSISARRIHREMGGSAHLWQEEYWDRFIRDGVHYERAVHYIYENPAKAGLVESSEDWPWSNWGEGRGGSSGRES